MFCNCRKTNYSKSRGLALKPPPFGKCKDVITFKRSNLHTKGTQILAIWKMWTSFILVNCCQLMLSIKGFVVSNMRIQNCLFSYLKWFFIEIFSKTFLSIANSCWYWWLMYCLPLLYSSLSLFSSVNCFSLSLFTEDPNEHHVGAVGQQL